jgi:hypothetical protein
VLKQIYFSNPDVEQNNAILDELETLQMLSPMTLPSSDFRTSNRSFKSCAIKLLIVLKNKTNLLKVKTRKL